MSFGCYYMLGFVGFVSMGRRWNKRERERERGLLRGIFYIKKY